MERILPYWSANMAAFWNAGITWWPGFNYTADEQALMRQQAAPVAGRRGLYSFVVATIFIAGLVVIVPGIMFPVLNGLYPDPSKLNGLVFAVLMASIAALSLGLWLPVAMVLSAKTVDLLLGKPPQQGPLGAPEQKLVRRIRWQLQRMALIMSGLLIPGIMAFIILDIDTRKGPLHFAIQAADVFVFVGTALYIRIAGRRNRSAG
jgi:hypothetical protein